MLIGPVSHWLCAIVGLSSPSGICRCRRSSTSVSDIRTDRSLSVSRRSVRRCPGRGIAIGRNAGGDSVSSGYIIAAVARPEGRARCGPGSPRCRRRLVGDVVDHRRARPCAPFPIIRTATCRRGRGTTPCQRAASSAGAGATRRAGPQHLADQRAGRVSLASDRRAAGTGRAGLVNIKVASHDALQELRTALDVLRDVATMRPDARPDPCRSRRACRGVRAGGLDVRTKIAGLQPARLPAAVELAGLSHRAGGVDQCHPPRSGEHVTVRLRIRRRRQHRGARRRRGRLDLRPATASSACASGPLRSGDPSSPRRAAVEGSELPPIFRYASHDLRCHRRRSGAGSRRVPRTARRTERHQRGGRGSQRRRRRCDWHSNCGPTWC